MELHGIQGQAGQVAGWWSEGNREILSRGGSKRSWDLSGLKPEASMPPSSPPSGLRALRKRSRRRRRFSPSSTRLSKGDAAGLFS